MTSAIHFKFKSVLEYDSITFAGDNLKVGDLKVAIVQQTKLNSGENFDLEIKDAQTSEEYSDESFLVPKNTSVIVVRKPGIKPGGILAQHQMAKKNERYSEARNLANVQQAAAKTASTLAAANPISGPVAVQGATEEDRIASLIEKSGSGYERAPFNKFNHAGGVVGNSNIGSVGMDNTGRGGKMGSQTYEKASRPGPNYTCHRCSKPGHWIEQCPTNGDPRFDKIKVRYPTGIPQSMLKSVSAPSTGTGLQLAPGQFVTLQPNEDEFARQTAGIRKSRQLEQQRQLQQKNDENEAAQEVNDHPESGDATASHADAGGTGGVPVDGYDGTVPEDSRRGKPEEGRSGLPDTEAQDPDPPAPAPAPATVTGVEKTNGSEDAITASAPAESRDQEKSDHPPRAEDPGTEVTPADSQEQKRSESKEADEDSNNGLERKDSLTMEDLLGQDLLSPKTPVEKPTAEAENNVEKLTLDGSDKANEEGTSNRSPDPGRRKGGEGNDHGNNLNRQGSNRGNGKSQGRGGRDDGRNQHFGQNRGGRGGAGYRGGGRGGGRNGGGRGMNMPPANFNPNVPQMGFPGRGVGLPFLGAPPFGIGGFPPGMQAPGYPMGAGFPPQMADPMVMQQYQYMQAMQAWQQAQQAQAAANNSGTGGPPKEESKSDSNRSSIGDGGNHSSSGGDDDNRARSPGARSARSDADSRRKRGRARGNRSRSRSRDNRSSQKERRRSPSNSRQKRDKGEHNRDRERDRERHRDRDRHRDRERDGRNRDRDWERDRDRDRERERERDRSHRGDREREAADEKTREKSWDGAREKERDVERAKPDDRLHDRKPRMQGQDLRSPDREGERERTRAHEDGGDLHERGGEDYDRTSNEPETDIGRDWPASPMDEDREERTRGSRDDHPDGSHGKRRRPASVDRNGREAGREIGRDHEGAERPDFVANDGMDKRDRSESPRREPSGRGGREARDGSSQRRMKLPRTERNFDRSGYEDESAHNRSDMSKSDQRRRNAGRDPASNDNDRDRRRNFGGRGGNDAWSGKGQERKGDANGRSKGYRKREGGRGADHEATDPNSRRPVHERLGGPPRGGPERSRRGRNRH